MRHIVGSLAVSLLNGASLLALRSPNDDSTFDPDTFMSAEVTGEMSTKFTPIPEGEYVATIDDIKIRAVKNGGRVLDVSWNIMDDNLKQTMNMEKIVVRQGIFLDVEPNGALSLGPNKNVRLGRLREGLGQNKPGQPWNFRMLKGAGPAKISVSQRSEQKEGESEPVIYNDVLKVTPLA